MISSEIKKEYDEKGFLIVHNAIDSDLAAEVKNHVLWLGEKYPDIRPEAFHHHLLIHTFLVCVVSINYYTTRRHEHASAFLSDILL